MSDFDFEELDKAVAGALASDDSTADESRDFEAPQREEVPVVAARESVSEGEKPVSEEPIARVAPAARRGSGRFMDVVHPSSDMRSRSTTFTPPSPTGATLSNRPTTPESSHEEVEVPAQEASPWAKPLESPFLPDAKVEKRPLGGEPAPTSSFDFEETPLFDEPDELLLEAPDEPLLEATTMPDPIDFAAQTSALSSETEDTGATQQPEEAVEVPALEERSIEDGPEESSEVADEETPEEEEAPRTVESKPEQPREVLESIGPASITQQYTEQPSSAEASGAIYDTEAYHQPVTTDAPKKHSGIWVFLWILLLIILGAGAGVAFYLFVLPML